MVMETTQQQQCLHTIIMLSNFCMSLSISLRKNAEYAVHWWAVDVVDSAVDGWITLTQIVRGALPTVPASTAKTKHLNNICTTSAQRLLRWSSILQMSYKCFVLTGSETERDSNVGSKSRQCVCYLKSLSFWLKIKGVYSTLQSQKA